MVNNELETMWIEGAVACVKVFPIIVLEVLSKSKKALCQDSQPMGRFCTILTINMYYFFKLH
jgi:hypothetical protein